MRRWRRIAWWAYGAGAAVVLASLAWLTSLVLELERLESAARVNAVEQERLRLALWRMDAWVSPYLVREASRPYFEYLAYFPQERAYTRHLSPLQSGDVLTASPLLTFESEFIRVHFQVDARGRWSSPQLPEGSLLPLAQRTMSEGPNLMHCQLELDNARATVPHADLRTRVHAGELALLAQLGPGAIQPPEDSGPLAVPAQTTGGSGFADAEWQKNRLEYSQRQSQIQGTVDNAKWNAKLGQAPWVETPESVVVGPLVPLWLEPGTDGKRRLACVRRVAVGAAQFHQGFVIDWERLRELLLAQVSDLLPGAELRPIIAAAAPAQEALRLASFPAVLHPGPAPALDAAGVSPVRHGLLLTWIAGLVVLAAVGSGLRAGITYADQRSRFASSVTHELRTPLTTFRMYAEMLARDMVSGEEERRSYCATLEREAERLSTLVENVLAFARLEERREGPRRGPVSLGDLLARHLPTLQARAGRAGMTLVPPAGWDSSDPAHAEQDAQVIAETDAVGQVLFNLVDNACKYGRSKTQALVELSVELEAERVHLCVRDHGPGVSPGTEGAIFRAFDRGGRDEADPNPGIGLGLALSRGLARSLGGELQYEAASGGGACFRLSLERTV